MGWNTVLKDALVTAASILGDGLMPSVTHSPYTGQNAYGEPAYGTPTSRPAVVVDEDTVIRDKDGAEIVAHTRITFLTAVAVDLRDKVTLPDGRTSPVLRVDYGVRASDGTGFTTEVWC